MQVSVNRTRTMRNARQVRTARELPVEYGRFLSPGSLVPIDWLVAGPATATAIATGVAALALRRHLKQRKTQRIAALKIEHARLEAATSELLSRVNDIDLASKYQKISPSISARLGECCSEVGKLAEALKDIETKTQAGDVQQANRLLLIWLPRAVTLSKEINLLRAELK